MARLTPVSPTKLEKVLLDLGFERIRKSGSHMFYRHADGRATTIPFHGSRDVGPVLLQKILKETKISREEYLKYS